MERALVLIKPDGMEKSLMGKVISKFEEAGLKVIAIKMIRATKEMAAKHYADNPEWLDSIGKKTRASYLEKGIKMEETDREMGMKVRKMLMHELTRISIAAFILEGNSANFIARKIAGSTEPRKADPSSIRGMYSADSYETADKEGRPVRNIVHVSETIADAEREIKVWFSNPEIPK